MITPIRYRPHHFLCSLGFENKGYSDAFIANMADIVVGQLRAPSGEEKLIEVTVEADDICAPCPKRKRPYRSKASRRAAYKQPFFW